MRKAFIVLITLIGFCAAVTATEAAEYIMHDLGDFGGDYACVTHINNNGQALIRVSYATTMRYYFWENGQSTRITGITPVGLTNNGQVIGRTNLAYGSARFA